MKRKINLIIFIVIGIVLLSIGVASATLSEPGSQDDPLVTVSYVEKRIEQIKFYIDQKIEEFINTANSNSNEIEAIKKKIEDLDENTLNDKGQAGTSDSQLQVVELSNGQRLIGKAGTEIILRGGSAKAIASQLGGLSDVTAATDIQMNQEIPANHLLIVPRDDGRGVYVEKYAIFMVRGEYVIQ